MKIIIAIANCGFFDFTKDVGYKGVCLFKDECCIESSIPGNIPKLRELLNKHVFGQHIATDLVVHAIAAHWNSPYAKKPLTMSFHGYTGSGKNYVSTIIAESLYAKGMNSKYVTLFSPGIHFPEDSKVDEYKKKLYEIIKNKVTDCGKQLFIFDEFHKMHAGIVDGIKAILDYHDNVENVDYRQSIFIFLSNTGEQFITSQYITLWRSGRAREDIKLSDFETMIAQGAFNAVGGFFRSEAIKNNLIDHYVPFLPMEREHVEACIRLEFKIRGWTTIEDVVLEEMMSFIEWAPPPENKFAKTGCKRLSQKVATIAFKLAHSHGRIEHMEL